MTTTIAAALSALILQQAPQPSSNSAVVPPALATQVMLDRAGFSPGAIDGLMGRNTRRALEAFKRQGGSETPSAESAVTSYTITPEDAQGPFHAIPEDMVEKSKLPSLGYASVLEALAEKFHATPALLERLNPDAKFEPGNTIQVPNVEPLQPPADQPRDEASKQPAAKPEGEKATGTTGRGAAAAEAKEVVVTVKESTSDLTVTDPSGRVLLYAPVTTGSENDPLPIGQWKVNGVQFNPTFHYNPDLFWDADPAHSKAKIPAGPNNPVGLVWIDISKPHYGIHGTPEPSTIGRTESHGCIRLTNWDALKLARLVAPGTQVVFEK